MTDESSKPMTPADWRKVHAFGLPSGSIRALLAIAIFATTWALLVLVPGKEVPDYLRDLLFIIMGHYFASRHRAEQSRDAIGPPPLYLPNGSVRILLVIGCIAVAAVLFRRGQLTDLEANPGVVTLLMVGGFLLGVVMNAVYSWWKARGHQSPRIVEDLRAGITVVAAGLLVLLIVNRLFPFLPPETLHSLAAGRGRLGPYGPEHLLAAVVGFYFGSRS